MHSRSSNSTLLWGKTYLATAIGVLLVAYAAGLAALQVIAKLIP